MENINSQQWFDGSVQKIVSLSAAIATNAFNQTYRQYEEILNAEQLPTFDSRVFNLPQDEVTNMFIWRQQDASRNSVNMLGQYFFSHSSLQQKRISDVHDMLHEIGVNWNDIATWKKRGFCVSKTEKGWTVDNNIPIFTEDRNYIEQHIITKTNTE